MSFTFLPQYDEGFSPVNHDTSVDQEQGFNGELKTGERKFWSLLKKNVPAIEKCFSFLRCTSAPQGSRNYFKPLLEVFTRRGLVESCPIGGRAAVVVSPDTTSRGNFNPKPQKLNLNNFLMILLCACSPVPPPTKIMLCLPAQPRMQADFGAAIGCAVGSAGLPAAEKKCKVYPFCVPQKLGICNSMAKSRGKYFPPPEKRICSPGCLHVSQLKEEKPCLALEGLPCLAHCFESHPKC